MTNDELRITNAAHERLERLAFLIILAVVTALFLGFGIGYCLHAVLQ